MGEPIPPGGFILLFEQLWARLSSCANIIVFVFCVTISRERNDLLSFEDSHPGFNIIAGGTHMRIGFTNGPLSYLRQGHARRKFSGCYALDSFRLYPFSVSEWDIKKVQGTLHSPYTCTFRTLVLNIRRIRRDHCLRQTVRLFGQIDQDESLGHDRRRTLTTLYA